jgi:glutathione synthase/RimK-type ligase-like ATP-grasp enzyme
LKRVGLIGPADRPELQRLAIRLEERGGAAVFIEPSRDPSIEIAGDRLRAGGEDISATVALYVADLGLRTESPKPVDEAGAGTHAVERSMRRLAAWNALFVRFARKGGLVVNPPFAQSLHSLKPFEVASYHADGIPAPRTLATSDALALAGRRSTGSALVIKGMVGGYSHTERFETPSSPDQARRYLADGPVQVQEAIEGDNVRAFVVAGEALGAGSFIPLDGAEIDSRRGKARINRVDLPEEASRNAIAAAGKWGMSFAAIDFMREDASGRFVVLECNSAPFFVAFEASTGVDVSGRLANHLLGIRRGR